MPRARTNARIASEYLVCSFKFSWNTHPSEDHAGVTSRSWIHRNELIDLVPEKFHHSPSFFQTLLRFAFEFIELFRITITLESALGCWILVGMHKDLFDLGFDPRVEIFSEDLDCSRQRLVLVKYL